MSKVVVFGGSTQASYNTYVLSRESKLEEDLSDDPLIPGYMCKVSYGVKGGKIYVVSNKMVGNWDWSMRVFDGSKWSRI